jgi:hypothetical protein
MISHYILVHTSKYNDYQVLILVFLKSGCILLDFSLVINHGHRCFHMALVFECLMTRL